MDETITAVLGRALITGRRDEHEGFLGKLADGRWEPYSLDLFRAAVARGATVIDGGAHIGAYTLTAGHRIGPAGRVLAFEPNRRSFGLLERNIVLNRLEPAVAARNLALAERGGSRSFFADEDASKSGLSPRGRGEPTDVRCVALDELPELDRIDVLKLDIEGGEVAALKGMRRLLAESPDPVLFVELNPEALRSCGHRPSELVAELGEAGFEARAIDDARRRIAQVPEPDRIEDHLNLICRRRSGVGARGSPPRP